MQILFQDFGNIFFEVLILHFCKCPNSPESFKDRNFYQMSVSLGCGMGRKRCFLTYELKSLIKNACRWFPERLLLKEISLLHHPSDFFHGESVFAFHSYSDLRRGWRWTSDEACYNFCNCCLSFCHIADLDKLQLSLVPNRPRHKQQQRLKLVCRGSLSVPCRWLSSVASIPMVHNLISIQLGITHLPIY